MVRFASALVAFVMSTIAASAQEPDGRLDAISKERIVKIAYRTDATPFSFVNENKEPAGYTIDLCKLVVRLMEKQLGLQELNIQWIPVTTQTRFDAVAKNSADMECGSSTATLSRMKQVDFSTFVFIESTGLVVKRNSDFRSFSDLKEKKSQSLLVPVMSGLCRQNSNSKT